MMSKSKKELEERQRVLARLAACETASLMNRSIEMTLDRDKRSAYERISKLCGVAVSKLDSDEQWAKAVKASVDQMIVLLRSAELTINFKAQDFFAAGKSEEKYTTKFERTRSAGAPMGDTRNQVEEKMFRYSEKVGVDPTTAAPDEKAAALRAEDYGVLGGKNFSGAIRPKYCSVNYPALVDGVGAQWGRSHIVLAEHLKPNMTFFHSDSFDFLGSPKVTTAMGQEQVANFHHMHRLVANMPEKMLESVADRTTGRLAPGLTAKEFLKKYSLGSTAYIEGHVHAEVYFSRDVKKIRVCKSEIKTADIDKNIGKFRSKYGVAIEIFDE